ncbi:dodecin domain-containing protein [candidate division KSB1 bacterium]|nr:dodecin domain-containing protein [candidate division KSB1 bacterium]NIR70534.1 dodecin domain-containing protein [candidate division KSB1 bacterium]NIS26206.1 dodecin domain-containing protein [candidate division KSB1 bacterium]NIT72985.1 dodecin domain-containing protein [candidate division KSB1 bacterium]NIU26854.1 dodecin domain-containing protein [candidate division KSB1 bacterium]
MAVARVTTITASSTKGFQDAFQEGINRATRTLRNVTGSEIVSQKAKVENGDVSEYRVTMRVTFILE